ncbi:SRPBCC family protein [Pseudoxanthomonas composti]|uniref:SRPBCC domain-containing protein n=1 Tax=Pseudoxanthomonas composti TaxID=2137479 RepID=A0A4Q1JYT1_9GAMM|nr:SRPBCC domain-containing protein [Pseudoxanthomonas composti]RXR07192.1 SRPBCC domain-containing protein [Pseudoxanthomonas composti]
MSTNDVVKVHLVRRFDAAPESVFDAWLTPRTLGRWMFGHRPDETVLGLDVDARVGGRFSLRVDRGDGPVNHVGRYQVLDRPRLLEFTWGIEDESDDDAVTSVVRLSLVPSGDGCELTLTHQMDARWAEYRDRTEQGWNRMLAALARLFD